MHQRVRLAGRGPFILNPVAPGECQTHI